MTRQAVTAPSPHKSFIAPDSLKNNSKMFAIIMEL